MNAISGEPAYAEFRNPRLINDIPPSRRATFLHEHPTLRPLCLTSSKHLDMTPREASCVPLKSHLLMSSIPYILFYLLALYGAQTILHLH